MGFWIWFWFSGKILNFQKYNLGNQNNQNLGENLDILVFSGFLCVLGIFKPDPTWSDPNLTENRTKLNRQILVISFDPAI